MRQQLMTLIFNKHILIFIKLVFVSQLLPLFFAKYSEIALPTWAEVYVPSPESSE